MKTAHGKLKMARKEEKCKMREREILRKKEIKRNIEKKREILYEQAQIILY